MQKKVLKIGGIILGVVLILFAGLLYYTHLQIKNGNYVKWGGQWYTKEQLKAKFPPQYIEVAAKNTPEEVYAKFRQSLLNKDYEGALNLITLKNREGYREAFKDGEKLDRWIKRLPEKITKESESGNFSYYDVDYGTQNKNTATFLKNSEGYWEIDSI